MKGNKENKKKIYKEKKRKVYGKKVRRKKNNAGQKIDGGWVDILISVPAQLLISIPYHTQTWLSSLLTSFTRLSWIKKI